MTATDTGTEYWNEVERILRVEHRAKRAESTDAVEKFRAHMEPAGQTIYNSDPTEIAATIIGHGLVPSLPAVGLHLQLAFALADPETVLADPLAVATSAAGLIDALSDYERILGGQGFSVDGAEALPGLVLVTLKPKIALRAADRLKRVAEEVERASRRAARADAKLKAEVGLRKAAGERVTASPWYKAA